MLKLSACHSVVPQSCTRASSLKPAGEERVECCQDIARKMLYVTDLSELRALVDAFTLFGCGSHPGQSATRVAAAAEE